MTSALGMIETIGLVSALVAADSGLKAADVRLLGTDYVRGGLVMVRFGGDVAAVKAAVDAGSMAASGVGKVFSSHVIARAEASVVEMVARDEGADGCASCGGCEGAKRAGAPCPKERAPDAPERTAELKEDAAITKSTPMTALEGWKVIHLRQAARRLKNFPLTPSDIRFAGKQTLLLAIRAWQEQED